MIVSSKHRHLHIHVPKTGGTSLQAMTRNHGWYSPFHAHATLPEIANCFDISTFLKTTTVRNPWSHAVSMYYQILEPSSFFSTNHFNLPQFQNTNPEQCLQHFYQELPEGPTFLNFLQRSYITTWYQSKFNQETPEVKFDYWFKFENYSDIILFFADRFKISLVNITANITKHKTLINNIQPNPIWQSLYTPEAYELVRGVSQKEIQQFNYTF